MTLRNILIEAGNGAGEIHEQVLWSGVSVSQEKFGGGDSERSKALCSAGTADIKSDEFLKSYLLMRLPGINYIGEESRGEYNESGKVVYADSLDGTQLF